MPLQQLPSDLPIHTFSTPGEFEAFLDAEHTTAVGCYIKLAKKASGIPSITAPEAVEVCLCFGWIDGGGGGSIDDKWWLTRYTPRRDKSMWSKKNTDTVARLVREGKMRPAGAAAVEAAKVDGRWDRAYDGPATITVPDDLAAALAATPVAFAFFDSLNRTDRFAVLHRVQTASMKTRSDRIDTIVQMLAGGNVPGKVAKEKAKLKQQASVRKPPLKKSTLRAKKVSASQNALKRRGSGELLSTIKSVSDAGMPRRPGLRPRG